MSDYKNLCMGCMTDKGANEICSKCGFGENDIQPLSNLPLRYLLDGRYLIGKAVESNSEGVVYLSWDTEENVAVRVHEYFPENFCDRAEDGTTVNIFAGKELQFNRYIDQFLNIARKLAKASDLPSLLAVRDIFMDNNTAYYVTEHVKAITMREFLIRNGGTLSWNQIRPLLMPVLTTVSALHDDGIIHRGISPETLLVGVDGKIRLTGFCVADVRTARSDMNAQLFPGFAAIEQYGFDSTQGTWTDVYGLCATLYRILVGSPPADATERVTNDRMVIPTEIAREIPRNVLTAMADGLAILSDDRTATVAQLKNGLIPSSSGDKAAGGKVSSKKYVLIATAITVAVLAVVVFLVYHFWIGPMMQKPVDNSSDVSAPISSVPEIVPDPDNPDRTYEVYDLVGMTYSEALTKCGAVFNIEVVECAMSNYAYGQIYEQSVKAGDMKVAGTTIEVKVSVGNGKITVPKNLAGKSVEYAIDALLKAGFRNEFITIEEMVSDTVEPGLVVETDPALGEKVSMFSNITVYVSIGNGGEEEESEPTSSSNSSSRTSSNTSSSSSSRKPSSNQSSSSSTSSKASSQTSSSSSAQQND